MSETAASECRCAPDHAMDFTFHQPPCQYVPATADAGDASEPLSEAERATLVEAGTELLRVVAHIKAAAATRARAEALREAADAAVPMFNMHPLNSRNAVSDWLRARADSLAPDTASDS